ncbi:MAG: hydrogenase maturation protease [Nostoc sp. ZfuVER08]|jgi:hydrogenase maturation protease|uniref:Hydrogenase maturation protease n=1 Tax=Nostoc punctiforme FACHB-252 TaxID=1357509 RepID=A0ABR8HLS7_NOSPU|nr:hydrogenase maturation protease [Nostoc punctiforme]MBD2616206.1 hydrogenase maturation protease [Nostoc punctiforme FACHB-252]MBL1200197.1 hydrogenase maturation protease [Nostoc sp. GBBB01]MDZ8015793.1 hydrogenase maturation protease [Nostoc sp. ZfuVER08]
MNFNVIAIGYGNELRSDDGIGQRVAKTLHLSNVQSLAVQQLTPELAQNLAHADLAIFIDACFTSQSFQIQVEPLLPTSYKIIAGHMGDPRSLLALTQAIYGYCPRSWWIKVPGVNFELGQTLSSIAETGVAIALQKITQIVEENLSVVF